MEPPSRQPLLEFNGIFLPKFFTDNWENIQNFKARPDDILIATYPKSGTVWVSFILDLLYFGKNYAEHQAVPFHERIPFLDMPGMPSSTKGTDLADQLATTPRIIKTHLPVHLLPKSFWEQNSRIIYVARNPKDNAVSFFHFSRMHKAAPEPGDWSTFLRNYMDGKALYGSWYEHVKGWWEKKNTYSNLHCVFYEDLKEDCGREIDKLCSFLGLSPTVEEKKRVMNEVTFNSMKENKTITFSSGKYMDQKVSPFMRKGNVGDWKNHFTVAQNEEFDEDYKQKMKNSTLKFKGLV